MEKIGIAAGCGMIVGFVFAVFSLIFQPGEGGRHEIVFCFGFFVGLVGAPQIMPEHFKKAALFQTLSVTFGMVAFYPI